MLIGGPYALYLLYLWLHLQSGLLRPAVGDAGPRQVLIVGSQSSGTSQLAASLQDLGLEVEHEHSDARWAFCRDGTVSWFHGLRFLPGAPQDEPLTRICSRWWDNIGFHPAMYRTPRRGCSYRSKWSQCWSAECKDILSGEWGCGLRQSCETPFRRNLLAVRHPLRTLESLVAKFCLDSSGDLDRVHPYLPVFAKFLFPASPLEIGSRDCLQVVGWYYVHYVEAMLSAMDAGAIDAILPVERSKPCDVARLAGFLNASLAVDGVGAIRSAQAACGPDPAAPRKSLFQTVYDFVFGQDGEKPVKNRRNKGRVRLDYSDLWNKEQGSASSQPLIPNP